MSGLRGQTGNQREDLEREIEELRASLSAAIKRAETAEARLAEQRQAANHWFTEANRGHNDLIRAEAKAPRLTQRVCAACGSDPNYHCES